jgi:hypothetical protein
MVDKA